MNNEFEDLFIDIFKLCYKKTVDGDIKYYYNENYILKEKLYRILGKNKPEKIYDRKFVLFHINNNNFWINDYYLYKIIPKKFLFPLYITYINNF